MIYGYNNVSIPDKNAYLQHVRTLKPPAHLFYQTEADFARQIKAEFPQSTVILRNWPDGDMYKHISPQDWFNQHAPQAAGGLMLYTTNEAGVGKDIVDWHVALMKLCIPARVPLCMLNAAHGTWNVSDMPTLRPLLELAGQHPDLFIVGVHGYAGGVITSGLEGGYPDNAGKQPGQPGGDNLIPRDKWPSPAAASTMTKFHVGRHEWIFNYCDAQHIARPRVAYTECGFDYLGDIGDWLKKLALPPGQREINGWHTLTAQWRQWWPDISADNAYVLQWEWAETALLNGVDFALHFCSGIDPNWLNYRVDDSGIPALMESLVTLDPFIQSPAPAPQPTPQPSPSSVPSTNVDINVQISLGSLPADIADLVRKQAKIQLVVEENNP